MIHVSPNQSTADVIDIMANKEVHKIPVVYGGKVVSTVSGTKFLRLFVITTDDDLKKIYQ